MKNDKIVEEFTDEQSNRIDDVYNAVYDLILNIVNISEKELPFDMSFVGPCAEKFVSSILDTGVVDKVYFPIRYEDESGDLRIVDYYGKDLMDIK